MDRDQMAAKVEHGPGFFAALDQSGGSTPGALRQYGLSDDAWKTEDDMFRLIHEMRVRIMSAPAFDGSKVLGAILFERTMDGEVNGRPVPSFLHEDRGVVPFLKVDKGLEEERNGVSLMKPIPGLEKLLERAAKLGVFGTKMRSVIRLASPDGIAEIVKQQFEFGERINACGLIPILEPEVSIHCPDKARAEQLLLEGINRSLDALPAGRRVMLKLTIPDEPTLYAKLAEHDRIVRVLALSGGYSREEACERLAVTPGMIASFSRALVEGLSASMDDATFDAALGRSIEAIYRASVEKRTPAKV